MKIECSIGEIVDKITILDIKCERIKDERVKDCIKEREILLDAIKDEIDDVVLFYRKCLKKINLDIWNDQDICRTIIDDIEYGKLAKKIIRDNDSRFRVKRMINEYKNSNLKEQKSYNLSKCVVACHLGLGDQINIIGAVRYLSTLYDEVVVFANQSCKIKYMYSDNKNIIVYDLGSNSTDNVNRLLNTTFKDYVQYKAGCFNKNESRDYVPRKFYIDFGIPFEYFYEYFFIPQKTEMNEILRSVENLNVIITHTQASNFTCKQILNQVEKYINNDNYIVIDVTKTHYPINHKYYNITKSLEMLPFESYIPLFKIAKEVYMIDSSIFCIAYHYLSKTSKNICYIRVGKEGLTPEIYQGYYSIYNIFDYKPA
jgi:hypothetical protein